jgi:hypothetical protein
MSILLCVSIAWVTLCVLFVGLELIVLLMIEHASNTSQAMMPDERISDQAPQLEKLDLAMREPVQKARELADTSDAPAQLENTVTLAPSDAIPTADGAAARRTQHTGAVIIRDPRLTRARTLGDQSGGAEETGARTSATQEIGAISEAMEVLSAEISHHPANSAQELDELISTIRTASIRGRGGSTPNR